MSLKGEIPKAFGGMCNLKTLDLSGNFLSGQPLDFIQNLFGCAKHSLEGLSFSQNQIMGSLPVSLGKLSNLESLYLGDNSLEGVISEAYFSKLTKLKSLYLSNTSLIFKISSDRIPPFQLSNINLQFCQLGPRFPKWLQTKKYYYSLDISNSRISDSLSNFNLVFSPQLEYMNLSYNQISGQIPNLSLEFTFSPIMEQNTAIFI